MKRILVLGCPGSGKSTLAIKLANITGIPVVHLDKLWWREGWVNPPKEEFDAALLEELKKDSWIIDGNYSRTLELRISYADTLIVFERSRLSCIFRVIKRRYQYKRRIRPDIAEGCPEQLNKEFLSYVWNFNKSTAPKLREQLSETVEKDIIFLKNDKECKRFLRGVCEEYKNV